MDLFETAIAPYELCVQSQLRKLRLLILETAAKTDGVGEIEEALRWNQPSFLTRQTGSGSTIRIDRVRNDPTKIALFVHCQSGLIATFKNHYGSELSFEGQRSIVLDAMQDLPKAALAHCISLALTHHLRKKAANSRASKT